MKKTFLVALLAWSAPSTAATAFWTGQVRVEQSVTYQTVMNCEYNYAGQTFWLAFKDYCPASVEVQ